MLGFEGGGIRAYPADYRDNQFGDKQLIPGLWYYDGGEYDRGGRHKKWIDALVEKGKAAQKEHGVAQRQPMPSLDFHGTEIA